MGSRCSCLVYGAVHTLCLWKIGTNVTVHMEALAIISQWHWGNENIFLLMYVSVFNTPVLFVVHMLIGANARHVFEFEFKGHADV